METYPLLGLSEPVNCLTHLPAAALFLYLASSLLRRGRGHWGRVVFLGVFAFSSVFLLAMSGVYHLLSPEGTARLVLQRLDHAAIFALIAGTFTAVHGLLFEGGRRWGMLLVIWAIAASGITLKMVFFAAIPEWLGMGVYLLFGWLGVVSGIMIWRRYDFAFIRPLVLGGLAYTLGAVLEFLRQPVLIPGVVGSHELFHLAVLAGIGYHWNFVCRCADSLPTACPTSLAIRG